ncbi:MAG: 2-C-methyl-D-erythritol 4-phosphate cytidylyltransferase [Candidatus Brocadiales bacterium]
MRLDAPYETMPHVSIILAAAGLGVRMGGDVKKPYLLIKGKPIFQRSLEKFLDIKDVKEIILVVGPSELKDVIDQWNDEFAQYNVKVKIVAGGSRRQDSVYEALKHLEPQAEIVLVHDAVRPIVTKEMIEAVINRVITSGAAILAVPVTATVKEVEAGERIIRTVNRDSLWMAQTPQGFRRDILQRAYDALLEEDVVVTDDAQAVERLGHPVEIVPGSHTNIKITTPEDLVLAEALQR